MTESSSTDAKPLTVGRFAPSPTGPLHVGSLVAALGSYLMAKAAGGKWLVRMEDLDQPRVVSGIADDMLATLETLGFQWDGEIVYQSRRTEVYRQAVHDLVRRSLAYPCGCSRAEIAMIASAPHDAALVYPGTCRDGLAPGKAPRAVRLMVTDEVITFHDGIMGESGQHLGESCGDFVIQRADGPFAYHLAVVVDDGAAGVNQIVRGADLLDSTPRQIYLQRLFGYSAPSYAHLPLVIGPEGGKLSKRDNAVSLAAGRDLTRDGAALLVAALRFLGQDVALGLERASCAEVLRYALETFETAKIPRAPAPFCPL